LQSGKSVNLLSKDTINFFRNLIVAKTCKKANDILFMPEEYFSKLDNLSKNYESHRMLRIMEIFSEADSSLRFASSPKIIFESAVVKSAMPEKDFNFDALFARVTELEKNISINNKTIPIEKNEKTKIEKSVKKEEIQKQETVNAITEEIQKADKSRVWGLFINLLRKNREVILYTICSEISCDFDRDKLLINTLSKTSFDTLNKPEYKQKIKDTLAEIGYMEFDIVFNNELKDEFEKDLEELKNNFENINITIN
jgi:hypothetical protein